MATMLSQKLVEAQEANDTVRNFMRRFEVGKLLSSCRAQKAKGFSVVELFSYLVCCMFSLMAWQKILCKRYSTKSRMALWKQGENWLESLAHHYPGSAERYARVSVNAAPRFRGNCCKGISQLLCLRTIVGVGSVPK